MMSGAAGGEDSDDDDELVHRVSRCHFTALPHHLVPLILVRLSAKDIARVACTCADLRVAATDDVRLWKRKVQVDFGSRTDVEAYHLRPRRCNGGEVGLGYHARDVTTYRRLYDMLSDCESCHNKLFVELDPCLHPDGSFVTGVFGRRGFYLCKLMGTGRWLPHAFRLALNTGDDDGDGDNRVEVLENLLRENEWDNGAVNAAMQALRDTEMGRYLHAEVTATVKPKSGVRIHAFRTSAGPARSFTVAYDPPTSSSRHAMDAELASQASALLLDDASSPGGSSSFRRTLASFGATRVRERRRTRRSSGSGSGSGGAGDIAGFSASPTPPGGALLGVRRELRMLPTRSQHELSTIAKTSVERVCESVWIGMYGGHGVEALELLRKPREGLVIARKVLGDPNVPCGEMSWVAHDCECDINNVQWPSRRRGRGRSTSQSEQHHHPSSYSDNDEDSNNDDGDDDDANHLSPHFQFRSDAVAHLHWRQYLLTRPHVAHLPAQEPHIISRGMGQIAESGFQSPTFIDGAMLFWASDSDPDDDVLGFAFGQPLETIILFKRANVDASQAAEKCIRSMEEQQGVM